MTQQEGVDPEAARSRACVISRGLDAGSDEVNWRRAGEELRRPSPEEDRVRGDEG